MTTESPGTSRPGGVTVVIPCFNHRSWVAEAIESALGQSTSPLRVVVVDDGSQDGSGEVIERYRRDPRVRVVRQENQGVVAAKNRGLQEVETPWTVFLDADDLLDRHYLERLVGIADRGGYDVVYTDMERFGAEQAVDQARPFSVFSLLSENYVHNSALLRTALVRRVGGYKEEMRGGLEDWELYLSLQEAGARFGYVPETLLRYRRHAGAAGRNAEADRRKADLRLVAASLHPELFGRNGPLRRRLLDAAQGISRLLRHPGWLGAAARAAPRGPRAVRRAVRAHVAWRELREGDDRAG